MIFMIKLRSDNGRATVSLMGYMRMHTLKTIVRNTWKKETAWGTQNAQEIEIKIYFNKQERFEGVKWIHLV